MSNYNIIFKNIGDVMDINSKDLFKLINTYRVFEIVYYSLHKKIFTDEYISQYKVNNDIIAECYSNLKNECDNLQCLQNISNLTYYLDLKPFMWTANRLNPSIVEQIQSRTFETFCQNKYVLRFKIAGRRATYMLFHPLDEDVVNKFKKMFDIGNEADNALLALHIFEKIDIEVQINTIFYADFKKFQIEEVVKRFKNASKSLYQTEDLDQDKIIIGFYRPKPTCLDTVNLNNMSNHQILVIPKSNHANFVFSFNNGNIVKYGILSHTFLDLALTNRYFLQQTDRDYTYAIFSLNKNEDPKSIKDFLSNVPW